MSRLLKHIFPPLALRKVFDEQALSRIEAAIAQSETEHSAEIRFAIDLSLDLLQIFRGETAKERAVEVFSQLRVWDTEDNNGVLIYLLLAEKDIEIVADRGAFRALGAEGLELACREMEQALGRGSYVDGICAGIARLSKLLAPHFPPGQRECNELPDEVSVKK